jgi:hypothetical protein
MWRPPFSWILGHMNAKPIEITLELQQEGDTVAGRARHNGTVREFSGRIGLMALVDAMLDEARTEDEHDAHTDGDH